jgi:hypothetical protein
MYFVKVIYFYNNSVRCANIHDKDKLMSVLENIKCDKNCRYITTINLYSRMAYTYAIDAVNQIFANIFEIGFKIEYEFGVTKNGSYEGKFTISNKIFTDTCLIKPNDDFYEYLNGYLILCGFKITSISEDRTRFWFGNTNIIEFD